MRKWILILVGLVVVLAIAAALAIRNLDTYLNDNRDVISAQAESALGRSVGFDRVGVRFLGGFGVSVEGIEVGDDPAWSEEAFVKAQALEVDVALWPALFGEIEVQRVTLRGPEITVIQNASGMNIDSLGGASDEPAAKAEAPSAESAGAAEDEEGPGAASMLAVLAVDVRDGTLRFIDKSAKPPLELALTQLRIDASDLRLDGPLRFALSAAALGAASPNLEVEGQAGPFDGASDAIPMEIVVELDPLDPDAMRSVPGLEESLPPGLREPMRLRFTAAGTSAQMAGDALFASGDTTIEADWKAKLAPAMRVEMQARSAALHLADLGVAGEGDDAPSEDRLEKLTLNATATTPSGKDAETRVQAELQSPTGVAAGAKYNNLVVKLVSQGNRIDVNELLVDAFDGRVNGKGSYSTNAAGRTAFTMDAKVKGAQLASIAAWQVAGGGERLSGRFDGDLRLKGAGITEDEILDSVNGNAKFLLSDGTLKGVNVAETALTSLTGMGGLSSLLPQKLRDKYPALFGVDDTQFKELNADVEIRDGTAHVPEMRIDAQDYTLSGSGTVRLTGALDMDTRMVASQALSDDLVDAVKQASYLRAPSGRIEIPVHLGGTMDAIEVRPDQKFITNALQGAAADTLKKGLEGFLKRRSNKENGEN